MFKAPVVSDVGLQPNMRLKQLIRLLSSNAWPAYSLAFIGTYAIFMLIQWPGKDIVSGMQRTGSWLQGGGRVVVVERGADLAKVRIAEHDTEVTMGYTDPAIAQTDAVSDPYNDVVAKTIDEQRLDAAQVLKETSITKVGDSDATVRMTGILALANLPTRQGLAALQEAVTGDADKRNRLLAIKSLASMARQVGDSDSSIRAVLTQAMYDADPGVASAAKAAYERIESAKN